MISFFSDNRVDFDDDLTHEIRPNKEVFTISHMSIAPHVCAMLNSGKFYFRKHNLQKKKLFELR